MSLNHTVVMGRIGSDLNLTQTQSGVSVLSFRVAVDRDFKDRETGERKADFINVVAWRSTAEFVARNFSKGRMAVVDGRLQIRDYTTKDGNRQFIAEVVANNVYFADSKREASPERPGDGFHEVEDEDDVALPF